MPLPIIQNPFANIVTRSAPKREPHLSPSPSPIPRRYSRAIDPLARRSLSSSPAPRNRIQTTESANLSRRPSSGIGFWSWDSEKAEMVLHRKTSTKDDSESELDESLNIKSPAKAEITTKSPSLAFVKRGSSHGSTRSDSPRLTGDTSESFEYDDPALLDDRTPPSSPPPLRFNTNFQFGDWILPGRRDTSIPTDVDFANWADVSIPNSSFDSNDPDTSTDSDFAAPLTPIHNVGLGLGLDSGLVGLGFGFKPQAKTFCHDGVLSDAFLDEALSTFRVMESELAAGAAVPGSVIVQDESPVPDSLCVGRLEGRHDAYHLAADAPPTTFTGAAAVTTMPGPRNVYEEYEDLDSTPKPVPKPASAKNAGAGAGLNTVRIASSQCRRQFSSRQDFYASSASESPSKAIHRKNNAVVVHKSRTNANGSDSGDGSVKAKAKTIQRTRLQTRTVRTPNSNESQSVSEAQAQTSTRSSPINATASISTPSGNGTPKFKPRSKLEPETLVRVRVARARSSGSEAQATRYGRDVTASTIFSSSRTKNSSFSKSSSSRSSSTWKSVPSTGRAGADGSAAAHEQKAETKEGANDGTDVNARKRVSMLVGRPGSREQRQQGGGSGRKLTFSDGSGRLDLQRRMSWR
ncbi:hypothetical protein BT96DRAFT_1025779 [Gymnopus androsaceus JB14]|uniref:Uncharacterized protein n=1 Tax=Gymnopus androsaceus JB14 TaxID=1447944 RepID=A0A6A4GR00_9AGAR|nr:hypothetical protein BT96DRAFT_1025779 [Gymnopus androsaceus JB14]